MSAPQECDSRYKMPFFQKTVRPTFILNVAKKLRNQKVS